MSDGTEPIRLTDEQRLDWLRLIRSQNVGPRTFRALINHFGGARAALDALPGLARRGGGGSAPQTYTREQAEREIQAARKIGAIFVAIGEAGYPHRLQMIDDPPPLIAIRGHADVLMMPQVGVVGSRNASAAGVKITQRLTQGLCEAGFSIASGLARGIDAAAHRASLATGTVAVLAGGLDRLYPPEHADFLDAILPAGVALTEMPFGWEPRARDFPRRNRLISGLSLGVVIVEAASARARYHVAARARAGREVLCRPDSLLDPRAKGTNGLIKHGANDHKRLKLPDAEIFSDFLGHLGCDHPRAGSRQLFHRIGARAWFLREPPLVRIYNNVSNYHLQLLGANIVDGISPRLRVIAAATAQRFPLVTI